MNLSNKLTTLFDPQTFNPNNSEILERNKLWGLYRAFDSHHFKRNWLLNQSYFDELSQWQLDENLSGIILKGGHLIPEYYSHPGERFMGDIDILIDSDQQEGWNSFLVKQGFEDITKDIWAANNFKKIFLKHSGALELVIELHTRLFYQEKEETQWKRGRPAPYQGLYYLEANDLFVHLCGHLAYQHTFLSLHWLYDIYLLVQRGVLDPQHIKTKAKSANVWRSCQLIAYILKSKLGLNLPNELMPSPFIKILAHLLITDDFLIHPKNSAWRYFLVKHLTKDHLHQAFVYNFGWLLQRKAA